MKRVILAAVFTIAISGYAAAQSTSAKQASKPEKATVKKGAPAKTTTPTNKTVLKQEASANAKADSTVKLMVPAQPPIDTSAVLPKIKSKDF